MAIDPHKQRKTAVPPPAWFSPPEENDSDARSIRDDMSYGQRLIRYARLSSDSEIAFLEYRTLHRLNIANLQNKLAKLKSSCSNESNIEENLDNIEKTLHRYANAIRNYAFIESLERIEGNKAQNHQAGMELAFFDIAELHGSPFSSQYLRLERPKGLPTDPLRNFLKNLLPSRLAFSKEEAFQRKDAFVDGESPKTISPFVDKLARFLIALTGGAALIVPMLIMLLPAVDLTKSLVTVGVAVFIFAFMVSAVAKAGNAEAIVATSTYAAVLVVFIGVNS